MSWSVIVGNGFTMDARGHCGIAASSSHPWGWPIPSPYAAGESLLSVMPHLSAFLASKGPLDSLGIYDALADIVASTRTRPLFLNGDQVSESQFIHIEACHYLRLAYAWFTSQFTTEALRTWKWTRWFAHHYDDIHTLLCYNYDTLLERAMQISGLGIWHNGSQMELFSQPPRPYVDAPGARLSCCHVAKPHGSSNFTSWISRQMGDATGPLPLYPIVGPVVLRGDPLRILTDRELFQATGTADLILPGEWSSCDGELLGARWPIIQTEQFIDDSQDCSRLLVIGFAYGEADRPEFDAILQRLPTFTEIFVVNPAPPPALLAALQRVCSREPQICQEPPC